VTYDLRALDGRCEDVVLWFPEELLNERIFHLPLDKVFVKTSHKETFEFAEDEFAEDVLGEMSRTGKGKESLARRAWVFGILYGSAWRPRSKEGSCWRTQTAGVGGGRAL
jgi:hypothetical protein